MKILKTEDDTDEVLLQAIKILKSGGIIAYPTETFYALGVNAMDEGALKRLYKLKGRPIKKPLPVIVGDIKGLKRLIKKLPPHAQRLIKKFWPGPLTIIFEASFDIPELLTAKTGKIAIRIPREEIALRLVKKAGFPVTSTSANPTGKRPAIEPEKVIQYFSEKIDLLIDGGKTPGGKPSTIVDVTGNIRIIRKGVIPSRAILDLD